MSDLPQTLRRDASEVSQDWILSVIQGPSLQSVRHFRLNEPTIPVGRSRQHPAAICLDDPSVSAKGVHLHRVEGTTYTIADEGALNPVRVNGVRVREPVKLSANDVIRVGDTLLVVDVSDASRSVSGSGARHPLLEALCMFESTAGSMLEVETRFFDPDSYCAAVRCDGFSEIREISDWLADAWDTDLVRVDSADANVIELLDDSLPGTTVFVERVDARDGHELSALVQAIERRCTEPGARRTAFSYRRAAPGSLVERLVELSTDAMLNVPPLADRRADILPGLRRLVEELEGPESFDLPALCAEKLLCYGWPGGLGELRRAARRLTIQLNESPTVTALALPAEIRAVALEPDIERVRTLTEESFEAAFQEYDGNMSDIAEHYGYARTYMYRLLRSRGIDIEVIRKRNPL